MFMFQDPTHAEFNTMPTLTSVAVSQDHREIDDIDHCLTDVPLLPSPLQLVNTRKNDKNRAVKPDE